jgi:dipeptidyl aminopeptidase/acylaminoacyl peptidase
MKLPKQIALLASFFLTSFIQAETLYQKPEALIDNLVKANSFSSPFINRQENAIIKAFYQEMPTIKYVAREQVKLGGVRFNPKNYTAIYNYFINQISYFDIKTKKEKPINFLGDVILRDISWSPDGKHFAVSLEKEFCQELWIVAVPSLSKYKVPEVCLNSILKREVNWIDSNRIFFSARTNKQEAPLKITKEVPVGPVVMESRGVVSKNRTYADLLKTPQDELNFEKALQSQLTIFDLSKKAKSRIGAPGIFLYSEFSPNKKKILVNKIEKPFSYVVPFYYFAGQTHVWDIKGKSIYSFEKSGPFESIPINGVSTGPREIGWMNNEEQIVYYAEALDKGDWEVKVTHRDELNYLDFSESKPLVKNLVKLKNRFEEIEFLATPGQLIVKDYERDQEWVTTFLMSKNNNQWQSRTLFSMSVNDDYKAPGNTFKRYNSFGKKVVAVNTDSNSIYFSGVGATPKGDRPFLKQLNLANFETKELFRSSETSYDKFESFLYNEFNSFLSIYESQTESPRAVIHDGEKTSLLYAEKNPYEILSRLKKEMITYKRADGALLSGVLYYPLNYDRTKKYPAIIQAYPLEYTDASVAGQVRGAQNKFEVPFRLAIAYNALRGYVVLDDAQMPIIGHPETKNDTFIKQLVSGAKASVDALDKRGLIDPKRVGVIGHSYGAFMVANLLTHSDLFATGIARSGAYNRTLTPNGFQGERRTFWKARDTYMAMSPFVNVDKIKKPIMLIHGMADNNPGTFTLQSERYFEALKGQGAIAKLVLLPEESHSYAAVESVGHVLYETFNWFDKYLKSGQ